MKRKRTTRRLVKEPTKKEMVEGLLRAINRPWDWWFAELDKQTERERGLRSTNDNRRNKAERDYQEYRDIAGALITENPRLGRATRHELAQKVREQLAKRGRVVSTRTIWEALLPKNKV